MLYAIRCACASILLFLMGCESLTLPGERTGSPDSNPPEVAIASPRQAQRVPLAPVLVEGTAKDTISAVVRLAYTLDDGPEQDVQIEKGLEVAFRFPVELGAPGVHTIRLLASDGAGNRRGVEVEVDYRPLGYRYEVTPLTSFPGDSVTPVDLNDSGHVLTRAKASDGRWHSYLDRNGVRTELGPVRAADLNNRDQVVGNPGDLHAPPFLWEEGRFQQLPDCGPGTTASALNDVGRVTGGCRGRAFIWEAGKTGLDTLPNGSRFVHSTPQAINNPGEMVGWGTGDLVYSVVIWRNGAIGALMPGANPVSGSAINDAGFAVGYTRMGRGCAPTAAYLWSREGAATDLGTLFGRRTPGAEWRCEGRLEETLAFDLNENVEVVGRATLPSGEWRGFLWVDGALMDLSDLLADREWVVTSAVRINEKGDILGTAVDRRTGSESIVLLRRMGS